MFVNNMTILLPHITSAGIEELSMVLEVLNIAIHSHDSEDER